MFYSSTKPKKLKCKIWFDSIKTVLSEWTRLDKTWFSLTRTRVGYASKQTLEVNKPGDKWREMFIHRKKCNDDITDGRNSWSCFHQNVLLIDSFTKDKNHLKRATNFTVKFLTWITAGVTESDCVSLQSIKRLVRRSRRDLQTRWSCRRRQRKVCDLLTDEWTLIRDVTQATFYYIKHKLESRCCL